MYANLALLYLPLLGGPRSKRARVALLLPPSTSCGAVEPSNTGEINRYTGQITTKLSSLLKQLKS